MEVQLKQIEVESRHILENMFPYYVYDMSEFMGWSPNAEGVYTFNSDSLDNYWSHADHIPYFIYADQELAGFVLVRKYPTNQNVFDIEQFFVLRKFKGQGVGKSAFKDVVTRHSGQWQIRVLKENESGLGFWLSAIKNISGVNFNLGLDIDIDLEMHFIRFETNSQ